MKCFEMHSNQPMYSVEPGGGGGGGGHFGTSYFVLNEKVL